MVQRSLFPIAWQLLPPVCSPHPQYEPLFLRTTALPAATLNVRTRLVKHAQRVGQKTLARRARPCAGRASLNMFAFDSQDVLKKSFHPRWKYGTPSRQLRRVA
jgi:hypothetical protein